MRLPLRLNFKKRFWPIALLSLSLMMLALPGQASWDGDVLGSIIGWIIGIFISALGLVLILVITSFVFTTC